MKKTISLFLICLLIFTSCVSTKINLSNKIDYSILKENKKYIIKTENNGDIRKFVFKNSTSNSIIGVYKKKELEISKDDILKINKFSIVKTVSLIFGTSIVVGGLSIVIALENLQLFR